MAFPIDQNDRLALAARILQKLSEIYPARSEPDLREQASNMEHFAFQDATDRNNYLRNVANIIKSEQAKANNTAQYNNATGNTSSSTTQPAALTAAAIHTRRARPQSVANGNVSGASARGRGRAGRPRSTSAVTNSSAGTVGATNNNPNFANMGAANGGIISAEMIINLQRQHQQNARQRQHHQQAIALRQQQAHALALQQARIRKHAIANGLNQAQVQALMATNPMFNANGNAQLPVRRTPATTAALPQQAHSVNRHNKAHPQQQQQTRQPTAQQVPRQNTVAPNQYPIVRQKLVTFFKTYKDDFNIIVAQLPAYVQATEPSKRDITKKRLRAAHTLFEAIRSNRVPLSVTSELVDGHSKFMGSVINWFKRTHPHIFANRSAVPANAANANNVNHQPRRAAPSNPNAAPNATRAKVQNVQNSAAVQHARATAVSQAAAHAQANATEQARLLHAQQQIAARAQLDARNAQQLAARQASVAVKQQPTPQPAPAAVRSIVPPAVPVKSNAAPTVQVSPYQAPSIQKKLPLSNRNGSPAGITKARPASTKANSGATGAPARGTQKITKEQYLAHLEKRVSSIFAVCQKIEKNASQQATAVEKAVYEIRRNRAKYSILSLQKFMRQTRDATYGKENMNANVEGSDKMVRAEKKFVCTSEGGLFISEKKNGKPSKDTPELNNLRDVVIADCRAARAKNAGMEIEITEEFGLPVVSCQLLIPEIKMPKLIIRVQRGYPTVSAVTYRLVTPTLGWNGTLESIRSAFRKVIHGNTPVESGLGVASMLDAWANVADQGVEREMRNDGIHTGDMGIVA